MKKILAVLIALVLVAAIAVPVSASGVDTKVSVATGGGNSPVVKCKWEQDTTVSLENGDVPHVLYEGHGSVSNSQFLPPGTKCGKKMIQYYAVVTDAQDNGNVAQVYADVYHPTNSPPPYNASPDPRGPLFKYEIPFAMVGHAAGAINAAKAANTAHLIKFQTGYLMDEITNSSGTGELDKGTADVWMGQWEIDYEQPAGEYTVKVYAIDKNSNISVVLENTFTYVGVSGVEVDFAKFNYGPVNLGVETLRPGDRTWANPAPQDAGFGQANGATVRNIGNTWAHVSVVQNDMGLGKDVNGMWNVAYDIRMGNNDSNRRVYSPGETQITPNYLGLSTIEELDFSIKVIKGTSGVNYAGTMTISSAIEAFAANPPADLLAGVLDPCP
jgi:hypothetical protein